MSTEATAEYPITGYDRTRLHALGVKWHREDPSDTFHYSSHVQSEVHRELVLGDRSGWRLDVV